jgi:tetratricopeptide (TPR) repeat protein
VIIEQSINTLIKFVEAKYPNTKGHSERVANISYALAQDMGYSPRECNNIKCIALMHDCGKIAISRSILQKPGKLTNEEYEVIKSHTTIGGEMLRDFTSITDMGMGAMYHHERYDGKGYPEGLAGEDIPLISRIICVADALDAMNSNRCYRSRLDKEYILSELEKNDEVITIGKALVESTKYDDVRMDTYRIMAEAYKAMGEYELARDAIQHIPEIYFTKLGVTARLLEGEEMYEAAQKQKNISAEDLVDMLIIAGKHLREKGETEKANSQFRIALKVMDAFEEDFVETKWFKTTVYEYTNEQRKEIEILLSE